jgi:general secretion pathway protein M
MNVRTLLGTGWGRMAPREQQLVTVMVFVVLAAMVWFAGVAPALRTLRTAPAQIDVLEAQWQSMQALAVQARSMQGRSPPGRDEALRELELSVRQRLGGSAQINTTGDRVTVVLKDAAPQSIAPWLSQVRLKARVVATQANLTRTAGGWAGTLVFSLPASP